MKIIKRIIKIIDQISSKDYNNDRNINLSDSDSVNKLDNDYSLIRNDDFKLKSNDVKLVAFYLPQFHSIPENDNWWEKGFTEWTNTKKTVPKFEGHYQPHIPIDLGYYDLTNEEVIKRQIELAKYGGIYGFCFYHYWFQGKRLLEKPVNMLLENKELEIPFCLCWANENWTRRWDGLNKELLIGQKYSPEDDIAFIEDISKYFSDERYIRIDGKPVLLVHRPELLPCPKNTIYRWKCWLKNNGFEGIYLIGTQGFKCHDASIYGFDATLEFPPNGMIYYHDITKQLKFYDSDFNGKITDYNYWVENKLYLKDKYNIENKFKCIIPSWDNTPRRDNNAHIFYKSSPQLYKIWLKDIIEYTKNSRDSNEQFVFINAWNEWGEGAHLEPDMKYGYSYLNVTRDSIKETRKIKKHILYISHDATKTGAPLLSLNIIKFLKEEFNYEVSIILLTSGLLEADFRKLGKTYILNNDLEKGTILIRRLKEEENVELAICSTVVTGDLVQIAKNEGYKVITLIHELPWVIKVLNCIERAKKISDFSNYIVFPATFVKEKYFEITGINIDDKSCIIPQGLYNKKVTYYDKDATRNSLREELNIDKNAKLVMGAGYGDYRKGIDLFINIAHDLSLKYKDIYFIWIGPKDMKFIEEVCSIEAIENKNFIFKNFTNDLEKYYFSSDIYLLTSREDPFPSVVLESMFYDLPIVGFSNAGGFTDIVKHEKTGFIVDFEDITQMKEIIEVNIFNQSKLKTIGERCNFLIEEKFKFKDYVYKLLELLNK